MTENLGKSNAHELAQIAKERGQAAVERAAVVLQDAAAQSQRSTE